MLPKLLTSIFGSRNDRLLKQDRQVVQKVNALEASVEQLSDTELRAKTDEFRHGGYLCLRYQIAQQEEPGTYRFHEASSLRQAP